MKKKGVYPSKLEQEVNLSGTDIFKYVEQFEISSQFSGEYIGWESQELAWDKTQLNWPIKCGIATLSQFLSLSY